MLLLNFHYDFQVDFVHVKFYSCFCVLYCCEIAFYVFTYPDVFQAIDVPPGYI